VWECVFWGVGREGEGWVGTVRAAPGANLKAALRFFGERAHMVPTYVARSHNCSHGIIPAHRPGSYRLQDQANCGRTPPSTFLSLCKIAL